MIEWFGLILHPVNFQPAELISFWLLRPQLTMQEVLQGLLKNTFGRGYGSYVYPTRLNISFGGPVVMPCQQKVISSEDKLLPLTLVSYAMVHLRMSCMWSLNFCDLLNHFLQVQDDFRKEFFAISAWSLWNRWNSLHFGRAVQPLSHIYSLAGNML